MNSILPDITFVDPKTGLPMEKQFNFVKAATDAALYKRNERFFFFGGGVNSGKTYTVLYILALLCEMYPGSKWIVVRKTYHLLKTTTIESAKKLFGNTGKWNWTIDDHRFTFHNGSRIHFMSEGYEKDKDLTKFLGLEPSGFFLEQLEELNENTYFRAIERSGRWKAGPNWMPPPPMIFSTFNPTGIKWVRDIVYKPYVNDTIPDDTYIQYATINDNPHATGEEKRILKRMNAQKYRQMVEGNWDGFESGSLFLNSYDERLHVGDTKIDWDEAILFSFDFNVNPITALMAQVTKDKLHIIKEFRQKDSNIFNLCDEIQPISIKTNNILITGDASGHSRSALANYTYYDVICQRLQVGRHSIRVPRYNLMHTDSRMICNYVLENVDVKINPSCEYLRSDIMTIEADEKNRIAKHPDDMGHLFDCFRYICNNFYRNQVGTTNFSNVFTYA